MKTCMTRLGAFAVFALSLSVFTGTAIAGNGHGGTPPGQAKKDQTPAAQPSTSDPASTQATVQASSSTSSTSTGNSANAPGQPKQAVKASLSTPGVKPSSATTAHKWTHATIGVTGASPTATGNGPKPDSSKQYGNGRTAAQIAVSNGAPSGTVLTGPGNSQPHKVAVCPKKKNRSGGVDVHAVKSYKTAGCATQQPVQQPIGQTQSSTTQAGVAATAVVTTTAPTAQTPGAAVAGVAGAQATIASPAKTHGAGGVLGAVTRLGQAGTRSTLPFTGFPLWITVLIALGLMSGGLAVRTRTGAAS